MIYLNLLIFRKTIKNVLDLIIFLEGTAAITGQVEREIPKQNLDSISL